MRGATETALTAFISRVTDSSSVKLQAAQGFPACTLSLIGNTVNLFVLSLLLQQLV